MNWASLRLLFLFLVPMLMAGCGRSYPSVSGKVTANGRPVEGVKVLFIPTSTKENPFPGPFSQGVTDEEGVYSLVARGGAKGSTIGENVVELYPQNEMEIGFVESEIALLLTQAAGDKNHPSYKSAVELKEKVKRLKSLPTGGKMTPAVKTKFTVPASGTESANFELTEYTSSKTKE